MSSTQVAGDAAARRWDYSNLAASYDLRVDYSSVLIADILQELGLKAGDAALDVGAGTGKLTALLRAFGLDVIAIEPNAAMNSLALEKPSLDETLWVAACGEALPIAARAVRLAAYGSSFNVLETQSALDECARVLQPRGHWLAVWNHRDLQDPLQREVEAVLHFHLPNFDYGSRRESPAGVVESHPAFGAASAYEHRFVAELRSDAWMRAWQSHATLQRQAGPRLATILGDIEALVAGAERVSVPYFTRAWSARRI